ncbi:MAG: type II secretion system protein [Puniceicoccales bacterium]
MAAPTPHRAFSLIELLAAMAVVAILSAVLTIGISKAREKAQMITCVGRLRTLGAALQAYSLDNKLTLLRPRNEATQRWPILLKSYLGYEELPTSKLYRQPTLKDPSQEEFSSDAPGIFGYNVELEATELDDGPITPESLTSPDRFPILATSDAQNGGGLRLQKHGPPPKALNLGYVGSINRFGPSPNYDTNAIFLFADWHVEAVDVCDNDAWPWNDPQAFEVR